MAYNTDFYKAYVDYLQEPTVRNAHDWALSQFTRYSQITRDQEPYGDIVDLGCGQFNEFKKHYLHGCGFYYTGIDKNINENDRKTVLHKGDYRDRKFLKKILDQNQSAFVSLFSSEITANYKENYTLYNWLFKTFPNIQGGLVSGFYYKHKKHQNPVREAGGLVSYQTLESIEDCKRIGYSEKRLILPVPSKMFGPHVMEVWKIFERKTP